MSEYVSVLLDNVLPVVFSVIGVIITKVLLRILNKFGDSLDSKTKSQMSMLIREFVSQGVAYSEQQAKLLKKNKGLVMPSPEKLEKAVKYVIARLNDAGITDVVEEKIIEHVESTLGFATYQNSSTELLRELMDDNDIGDSDDYLGLQ